MSKPVENLDDTKKNRIVAVDVGTMNIVSAEMMDDKNVEFKTMRNMFLPVEKKDSSAVQMSQLNYIEGEEHLYVIGDDAFAFSNLLGVPVKRPMMAGLISSEQIDSIDVLTMMMQKLVGKTINGRCIFSVPAPSVDKPNDIIYHEGVLKRIFDGFGFVSESFNEAMAIVYSQFKSESYTGISFSFGAGQCNVACSYKTIPIFQFSVARSGDWIDESASRSLGIVQNRITALKEKGIDLMNASDGPKKESRSREAIMFYYREMVRYALSHVRSKLKQVMNVELPQKINIVVSGGTSMAKNFLPFFRSVVDEFRTDLPFQIDDIRMANDPLNAVAEGLLIRGISRK